MSSPAPKAGTNVQVPNIRHLFMPTCSLDTKALVSHSGEQIAKSLAEVLERFFSASLFPDQNGLLEMALMRLHDRAAANRTRWLSSPLFRGWIDRLRIAMDAADPLASIARVLEQIPDSFLPTPDYFEHLPQWRSGVAEYWEPAFRVTQADDGGHRVTRLTSIAGTEIVVRHDLPSTRLALDRTQAPQRESAILADGVASEDRTYPPYDGSTFDCAMKWLSDCWPQEFADFLQTVQLIVPIDIQGSWSSNSFTLSSMQGACWVTQTDILTTFECLVHEQSHIKLRYIEDSYPLLAADQADILLPVGWRTDPRPLVGIFEGVYVHIHIAHALLRLLASSYNLLADEQARRCTERLRRAIDDIAEGVALLQQHARWTEYGEQYLGWAVDEAESLRKLVGDNPPVGYVTAYRTANSG